MITKVDLNNMSDGQTFETVALIKSYESRPTKNGNSKYIDGSLEMKGTVAFKVWAGPLYDEMEKYAYEGTICHIKAKANDYNGVKSIILSDVKALEKGVYDESDFFEEVYQVASYWDALIKLVKKNTSEAGFEIFSLLVDGVKDRFMVEFAAKGHHDAVRGGLLAHTYKNVLLTTRTIKLYSSIMNKVDMDLMIVGMAVHDIGKVKEYSNGSIKDEGLLVSHHTFGVEMVFALKDRIVELKGEEFYYRLLSIIEQHHGQFEETPRTVEAYLIHTVDLLESRFQSINEGLQREDGVINIDGFKLR